MKCIEIQCEIHLDCVHRLLLMVKLETYKDY